MSKEDTSILAVRLLALYLIAQGVIALPDLGIVFTVDDGRDVPASFYLRYSVAFIAPLLVGFVCLILSKKLGSWISDTKTQEGDRARLSVAEVHAVAISTLGLVTIFLALPEFVEAWARTHHFNSVRHGSGGYLEEPHFLSSLVALIFGIVLFAGVRFWVELSKWCREFGLNKGDL